MARAHFRLLTQAEREGHLFVHAVTARTPLLLGPGDDDGICGGCRATLTRGNLAHLRAYLRAPFGSLVVLGCAECGGENVTPHSQPEL